MQSKPVLSVLEPEGGGLGRKATTRTGALSVLLLPPSPS